MTINSISGGRTSSYMCVHYPADYNVFALVCIDDPKCTPKDKKMVQYISDKIGREFIATAESDITLKVIMDLEQMLGKEILWVVGDSFDKLIIKRKSIPNQFKRWCTTQMKIMPIIYKMREMGVEFPYQMNLGIRADESERAKTGSDTKMVSKIIVGKHPSGRNKWQEVHHAYAKYPLIENMIYYPTIIKWAEKSGLVFPKDSNCVGCFWKPAYQLRKNYDDENQKMKWFESQESIMNRRWKKEISYESISKMGLQSEMIFGTGAGCNAGYCTD